MTDKELKHLRRPALIDIIYELQKDLQKQSEEKDAKIAELQSELDKRTLQLSESGSIAEAALRVNGVLEAAQAAADQYLGSIREAEAARAQQQEEAERQQAALLEGAERQQAALLEEANRKAEETILLAKGRAQTILEKAEAEAAEKWETFERRANDLIQAHADLQALLRRD